MRVGTDGHGHCPKWIAIGQNITRATPTLKMGALLLAVALCCTLYMMIGSMQSSDPSAFTSAMEQKAGPSLLLSSETVKTFSVNQDADYHPKVKLKALHPVSIISVNRNHTVVPVTKNAAKSGNSTLSASTVTQEKFSNSNFGMARAPVPCENNGLSELLEMRLPTMLKNYKNPCWWERLEDAQNVYGDNAFAKFSNANRKTLNKLKIFWRKKDSSVPQYRLRCLPYFFLAGQPKCGSTDLYRRLTGHPDIVTMPTKEPHWWGKFRFAKAKVVGNEVGAKMDFEGNIPFTDYLDLFDDAALKMEATTTDNKSTPASYHPLITGDFSVSTLWSNDGWWKQPENCGRLEPQYTNAHYIQRHLPHAKIIVILRNPTDRLYSDFLYFHYANKSKEAFHNEVKKSIVYFKECVDDFGIRPCLYNISVSVKSRARLRLGMYALYLDEWLALFPRDQIYVVRLEDYSEDPLRSIRKIHKFLDVRSLTSDENEEILEKPKANTRREKDRKLGGMLNKTREMLQTFYRPFNQKLAHILQDDRFLWEDDD